MLKKLQSQTRFEEFKSPDVELIAAPWGFGGTDNLAQEGAYSLLSENELIKKLAAVGVDITEINPPSLGPFEVQDSPQQIRNIDAIVQVNTWLADTIFNIKSRGHIPLVLGGDASLCIGSVNGLTKYYSEQNKELGIIWLNNHLCNSSPRVTKSWNANRMAFTALTYSEDYYGKSFDELHEDFKRLVRFNEAQNPAISDKNIVHLGINHKSAQERIGHNFYSMEDVDELGPKKVINLAFERLAHCDHIHIIWDLNSLDLSGVSNYSLGQLNYREAVTIARQIDLQLRREQKLSSIDVVEHCPSREAWDKRGETAEWAMDIITNIFGENIINAARKY